MAFQKTVFSLALSLAFCTAVPPSVSVASPGDENADTPGRHRAEVAALGYTVAPDSVLSYNFITNEYAGDALIRQYFCESSGIKRPSELEGIEIECLDIKDLGLAMKEIDSSMFDFKRFERASFNYTTRGGNRVAPVTIVIHSVRSAAHFSFHVRSGPENERIDSAQFKLIATEFRYRYRGDQRFALWLPRWELKRQIEPYRYSKD